MLSLIEKSVNPKQFEAILNDGNVLLEACPGSGKTRTLIYKAAYELSKLDSNKKFIVAITYTNRAADEIKERISLLGVETKQLWIGTIHSFCLEWILRPYSLCLPQLKYGFRVIGAHDRENLIADLCNKYNEINHLSRGNKIKCWDCEFFATPELSYSYKKEDSGVRWVIEQFFLTLEKNNQIDFEQILLFSLTLLKNNHQICKVLSNIFSYFAVDEYQDTKEIQYHILGSIIRENADIKLFMVGDLNQSIYQNLGAYQISITELEKLCSIKISQMELVQNYRSSIKIVDYFNYFKVRGSCIEPYGKDKDFQSIITLNRMVQKKELVTEIANLIKWNVEDCNIKMEEVCVVAPQWTHLASLTKQLIVKLPDYSFDGPLLTPISRDIDNFWYKLTRIVLTKSSPNLYVRRLAWANEVLYELECVGINIKEFNAKRLLKFCNSIEIDETDGLEYLRDFFNILSNKFEFNINVYPALQEHYDAYFESAKVRIKKLNEEGMEFIGSIDNFKKVFSQKNGVTISTCHGVKGTEYDTVIAFGLLGGYIPHFADKNGNINANKLLYVVCSRARKNLHLIAETERFNNWHPPKEYEITPNLESYCYCYDEM